MDPDEFYAKLNVLVHETHRRMWDHWVGKHVKCFGGVCEVKAVLVQVYSIVFLVFDGKHYFVTNSLGLSDITDGTVSPVADDYVCLEVDTRANALIHNWKENRNV